jgi:hypothetical protein
VDTGGADSQEFRSALLAAHTLLMPLRPGSFDLWTLMKMQEISGDCPAPLGARRAAEARAGRGLIALLRLPSLSQTTV